MITEKKRPDSGFLMQSAPGAETVINGRTVLYFGGTGYFGLHGHPEVIRAGIEAFAQGTHSATIRSGFGNNPILLDVERRLAGFFGTEDAVYYASGYLNGLFLARTPAARFDIAFVDEACHFGIRDGMAASGKPVVFYRHRDPEDLSQKLRNSLPAGAKPLVLTDGVFPAFGEIAPVADLLSAIEPFDGILALDDAHGVGILGDHGRGTLEHFGKTPGDSILSAGTLSKAFGGYGGFIPGGAALIAGIRETVGAYAGSTPVPTPIAAASAKGIELVLAHPEWREKLRENTGRMKSGLRALGLEAGDSPVPIAAWTLDSAAAMKRVQELLWQRGIAVAYLKYAGTPEGGILRATVFSTHTAGHIDRFLEGLKSVL